MRIPIAATQSAEHSSQSSGYKRAINVFAADLKEPSDPPSVVLADPGMDLLVEISGSETRAIINIDNTTQFAVVDNHIYSIVINDDTDTAVATSILETDSSVGKVRWAANPTQIIIVDGTTTGYIITIAASTAAAVSDGDFVGGSDVVFMDGYFIVIQPNTGVMQASALNDGTSWNAIDIATAEGKPDKLVGLVVDKRQLIAFGKESIEFWYNAGNASGFPFSKVDGAFVDLGCVARDSICAIGNTVAWVDNRNVVNILNSYQPHPIASTELTALLQSASTSSDIYSFAYESQGHIFYAVTSPSLRKTMVYDIKTTLWHQTADYWNDVGFIESNVAVMERYKQTFLAGEKYSGKIYKLNANTYTRGGVGIKRLFTTANYINEHKFVGINRLELRVDAGYGSSTGEGQDPYIEMRYSNDGGHTWSDFIAKSLGAQGVYNKQVEWRRLGSAREWMFEFTTAAPIKLSFIDIFADVEAE